MIENNLAILLCDGYIYNLLVFELRHPFIPPEENRHTNKIASNCQDCMTCTIQMTGNKTCWSAETFP